MKYDILLAASIFFLMIGFSMSTVMWLSGRYGPEGKLPLAITVASLVAGVACWGAVALV